MDKLLIRGGRRLEGEVTISGAKNAALPELCAALLTAEPVTLQQRAAPAGREHDAEAAAQHGRAGRAQRRRSPTRVTLDASRLTSPEAPYELVKTMRASILVLGPLLARFGEATRVAARRLRDRLAAGRPAHQGPAGDGRRRSRVEHGYIVAQGRRNGGLKGARITTDMVTVTGTENLLMAATLADGETVLENAAQEPEIADLAELLIAMGAQHRGPRHQPHPHPGRRAAARRRRTASCPTASRPAPSCAPWRPPAATWCCGGARADHLDAVIDKLREAGVDGSSPATTGSACAAAGRPKAVSFRTSEYPAFPTDMQAQFMALELHRRRARAGHRDDLREPLHARQRTAAPGREHRDRRPHRGGARRRRSCPARP